MIEVSSLSFAHNGGEVLQNISLEVKQKDFVALIGPNGSGKTTLVKLILGKLKPKKGTVKLFGKSQERFTDWNKIGYVPQRFEVDNIFPGTVEELLSVGKHKKMPSSLGMEALLHKKFSELSGGQQQKVLIAFALQSNPKLLILDEPTVGIDTTSQQEFFQLLKELNTKQKVTIILVTHDVGMIPVHFKRVICINKSVCCQGPVSETENLLKEAYGEHFVMHTHK